MCSFIWMASMAFFIEYFSKALFCWEQQCRLLSILVVKASNSREKVNFIFCFLSCANFPFKLFVLTLILKIYYNHYNRLKNQMNSLEHCAILLHSKRIIRIKLMIWIQFQITPKTEIPQSICWINGTSHDISSFLSIPL